MARWRLGHRCWHVPDSSLRGSCPYWSRTDKVFGRPLPAAQRNYPASDNSFALRVVVDQIPCLFGTSMDMSLGVMSPEHANTCAPIASVPYFFDPFALKDVIGEVKLLKRFFVCAKVCV